MRERRRKKKTYRRISGVDIKGNTVPFPEPPWDLEQLPIPIFRNQNVFLLMPNEENSHLFPMVPVSLQQTVGNVPPQNENEAFIPEFEEMDEEALEQMEQKTEVAQSEQVNNGGDANGEEGQVLHPLTN